MDTHRLPRISRHEAKKAARALDVETIERYVATNSNVADASRIVQSLWFSALGHGNIALLDNLYDKSSQGKPAWGVPNGGDLILHALIGQRPDNVAWALDHLPPVPWALDGVRRAVDRALGIVGRPDAEFRPFPQALHHIIERYPDLMVGVNAPSGFEATRRWTLNLISRQAAPEELLRFIDFLDHRPQETLTAPRRSGVDMWINDILVSSTLPEFSRLALACDQIPRMKEIIAREFNSISGQSANLWQMAITTGSPLLEALLSLPAQSIEGQAFSRSMTDECLQAMANKLGSSHPARLARLLSQFKPLATRMLDMRTANDENLLHLLAQARVSNSQYANPKELSWSRLEGWIQQHAVFLANEPRRDGVTPLALMGAFPAWSSRLRKQLLAQRARPAAPPSPRLSGPRL